VAEDTLAIWGKVWQTLKGPLIFWKVSDGLTTAPDWYKLFMGSDSA